MTNKRLRRIIDALLVLAIFWLIAATAGLIAAITRLG